MFSGWQRSSQERAGAESIGPDLRTLRAALDEVEFGVVLLDAELRAQFINRAFREMWQMPDAKADSKPAFLALMYHGRDTRAYEVPASGLDAYVAERVAHVKAGDPAPLDLRLSNGEVLRFQCKVLPAGGRMLSYTYVTDIVRHADEMDLLHAAFDEIQEGVILLDANLRVRFMNRMVRTLWKIPDDVAESRPSFPELVNDARLRDIYGVRPEEIDAHVARRIVQVRAGDPLPVDFPLRNGRIVRSKCTVLPGGGRMLTYHDVTDLVKHAQELNRLATTDGLTGITNRRHFMKRAEDEWDRFQRYHRPLSLLSFDVDPFKRINDRFGHGVGDQALMHLAEICREGRRTSDVVARIGGEEFALLLPETDLAQARIVAERLRENVAQRPVKAGDEETTMTISIGVAEATLSMPDIAALMKLADQALYEAKEAGRNRTVCAEPPGLRLAAAAE